MSDRVLTQEEISALLAAIGGDEEAEAKETKQKAPAKKAARGFEAGEREGYLFPMAKATELSREVESSLALIFDAFSHKGGASFSHALRTQVAFRVQEVEQVYYGDFLESLPEPSSIWYLLAKPHNLHLAVCFEPELVGNIVSVMLGGSALGAGKGKTQITDLEQGIIENVVSSFCSELRHAWSRVAETEFEIDNRETRPRLLRIYPPNEVMVTLGMSMKIGPTEGVLYWAIPSGLLKTLQDRTGLQRQAESQEQVVEALNRMKALSYRFLTGVSAATMESPTTIGELLDLKNGDVLALDHPTDQPVLVRLNGKPKFLGRIVTTRNRRGIRIEAAP